MLETRRTVLKTCASLLPAVALAGCPTGPPTGALDAVVRNGTQNRLSVSARVVDKSEDSTVTDKTLALAPGTTVPLVQSENTFRMNRTYTIEVNVNDGPQDTYEWEANEPLRILVQNDGIDFLLKVA